MDPNVRKPLSGAKEHRVPRRHCRVPAVYHWDSAPWRGENELVQPIYLDHAATTPLRAEVRAAMKPYVEERFGNPASAHGWGRTARVALEESRERLAAALGARRGEIVFTGSGTEADNLAVIGRLRAVRRAGGGSVVACSAIEHRAVLAAVAAVAAEGGEPGVLGVDAAGVVDTGALDEALRARPAVVSVMWGNNEIVTLQPVARLAERCAEAESTFHTDAVQAFGKVRVRVDEVPVDLLSVSAHKIGGPRGVGALFVRDGVRLEPLLHGGGQEAGLRPGTVDVAGAVGLATAAELAVAEAAALGARLGALRDRLERELAARVPQLEVLAADAPRLPQISSLWVPVERDALLMSLDMEGTAVSAGSACQSGGGAASHVLAAIGRETDVEGAAGRISLGWTTTEAEVQRVIEVFPRVVERIRALAATGI